MTTLIKLLLNDTVEWQQTIRQSSVVDVLVPSPLIGSGMYEWTVACSITANQTTTTTKTTTARRIIKTTLKCVTFQHYHLPEPLLLSICVWTSQKDRMVTHDDDDDDQEGTFYPRRAVPRYYHMDRVVQSWLTTMMLTMIQRQQSARLYPTPCFF